MYYDQSSYAALGAIGGITVVVCLILAVIMIVAMWRIFIKAGEPGWAAIIPLYNAYVMFRITWGKGWYLFLCLIPIVNIVILVMTILKLAKVFGKGVGFAIGLILLSFIFTLILAFDSSTYLGPDVKTNQA